MGLANSCFSREKDDNKSIRTRMILEYLKYNDSKVIANDISPTFKEMSLGDTPYSEAECLDENFDSIN